MKISDWSKVSTNQDQGDGLLPHHESITLRNDVIHIDGDITKKKGRERKERRTEFREKAGRKNRAEKIVENGRETSDRCLWCLEPRVRFSEAKSRKDNQNGKSNT